MGSNIVSANFKTSKPSYTSTKLTVSSNIINADLYDTQTKGNGINSVNGDVLENVNLTEQEYSLEQLLADAKKQREVAEQLIEDRKREVEEKNKNAVRNFYNKLGSLDLNKEKDLKELVDLYNSLSEDEKKYVDPSLVATIKQIDEELTKAEKTALEREKKLKELENLYKAREDNNGLIHPIKEANIEEKILKLEKELGVEHKPDGWEKFYSTTAVIATTAVSGVLDIYEAAADGLMWVGGMVTAGTADLLGFDEFADTVKEGTMDVIAVDAVGELNKVFYENTELGRHLNSGSAMKYDSEEAQFMRNLTKEVVIIAGATAATIATGGAAAPLFAAGFAIGAGESAEEKFQDKENRDFYGDALEIGIDGTIKGLSTMAYGKAGASAVNGVKSLSKIGVSGVKEFGKKTLSSISKESIKQTAKQSGKIALKTAGQTLIDKDTLLETGAVLLDDVKTGIQTGEWNVLEMIGDAALIYGENYIANLGAGFLGELNFNGKAKPSAITQSNTVVDYTFDRDGYINHVNDLLNQGYDDKQIVDILAEYGDRCSQIGTKLAFSDFSYEYLISRGYDPKDAAVMLQNSYETILKNRGMTTIFVDSNGIKYNMVNGFNQGNQAYYVDYIRWQLESLPQEVRQTVSEVNIYDTFNPCDYYWNNEYNSTGGYFRSAATGGDGTINLWANSSIDTSTIPHEAGHCFDVNRSHSGSQEYIKAIQDDQLFNGLESVTEYGKNNACEDFAETMAAYFGQKNGVNINEFPNRKAYFDKVFGQTGSLLNAQNVNSLNQVTNILAEKYGGENVTRIFYEYLTTGDINKITRTGGARDIISGLSINEVLEYYNIINGG